MGGSGEEGIPIELPRYKFLDPPELWAIATILAPDLPGVYRSGQFGRYSLQYRAAGSPQPVEFIGGYVGGHLWVADPNHAIQGPHHVMEYSDEGEHGLIPETFLSLQDVGLHGFHIDGKPYYLMQSELGTWAKHCKSSHEIRFQSGFRDAAVFSYNMVNVVDYRDTGKSWNEWALGIYEISTKDGNPQTLVGYLTTASDTGVNIDSLYGVPAPSGGVFTQTETSRLARIRMYGHNHILTGKTALPDFANVRFPKASLDTQSPIETETRDHNVAVQAFIEEIRRQGIPASGTDPIDVAKLKRFHVRAAGLSLPRNEDHRFVQDILMSYVDIKDDIESHFRRIGTYFLGRLALQHAVVNEIYHMLSVDPEEMVTADPVDVLDVLETAGAISGGYFPHVNTLINVISLAIEIVEASQPQVQTGSVHGTVSDLIRRIQDDYLKISYGLEILRDRNVVSVAALREWQEKSPEMQLDTRSLDAAVNQVFRRQVTSRLLQVGCRLTKSISDKYIFQNFSQPDIQGYYDQVNRIIDQVRREDPTVVAIDEGKYVPVAPGADTARSPVSYFRLQLWDSPLPSHAIDYIFSPGGFSRSFLWEQANIKVIGTSGAQIPRPNAIVEKLELPQWS